MKLPAMFRPLTRADKFKRMAQALHAQADEHAIRAADAFVEARRQEAEAEHHAKLARILRGEAKVLEEKADANR